MALLPTFCGKDCGGNACPLLAVVENGRVKRVRYNPAGGRYIRGCPRGLGLPSETSAPDRILAPLVRTGPRGSGQFREAGWDEALAITARNLGEIRAKYGPAAVMSFSDFGSHRSAARHPLAPDPVHEPLRGKHAPDEQLQQRGGAVRPPLPSRERLGPLRLRRGDDAAFPDDRALGGERPGDPHGRGDGPAPDRSRAAGHADRRHRTAPFLSRPSGPAPGGSPAGPAPTPP